MYDNYCNEYSNPVKASHKMFVWILNRKNINYLSDVPNPPKAGTAVVQYCCHRTAISNDAPEHGAASLPRKAHNYKRGCAHCSAVLYASGP
jgi:hypothetical protein